MHDVGIGDGQDDRALSLPSQAVEHVLQVDNVGLAVAAELGVHAMVGRQAMVQPMASSLAM